MSWREQLAENTKDKEYFTLSDFEDIDGQFSDGIAECESIIKAEGGIINSGMIIFGAGKEYSEIFYKAATYLCDEWDYAAQSK